MKQGLAALLICALFAAVPAYGRHAKHQLNPEAKAAQKRAKAQAKAMKKAAKKAHKRQKEAATH